MKKKPNFIIFMADQLRTDALGFNGNSIINTPNIDSLAAQGTNFPEAYVCHPLCLPQRTSMLCGLYPSAHNSIANGIGLDRSLPVYPELLRKSGYQTYAAGKMHFRPISRGFDDPPYEPGEVPDSYPYYGFEKIDFVEGEKSQYLKMLNQHPELKCKNPSDHCNFKSDGPFQLGKTKIPEELHRSTWIADRVVDFIQNRNKESPFLLHCSFWNPHHPFDPPAPFDTMYNPDEMPLPISPNEDTYENLPSHFKDFRDKDWGLSGKAFSEHTLHDWQRMKAAYYGSISLIDKNIGKVIQTLKDEGLYDDTIIFFISDHGELLGDRGLALKGPYMYQSLIKVPFIFSHPSKFKSLNFEKRIMSYDIMPTILELADLTPPSQITARSLIGQLEGRIATRETVMVEHFDYPTAKTIVSEDYKLTCYKDINKGELFDLKNDKNEMNNLWNQNPKKKLDLLLKLNQLQMENKKPSPTEISRW